MDAKSGNDASESREQLSFELLPKEPFSLSYFVTHTGVSEAVESLSLAVAEVLGKPDQFRTLFLYGPSGSGKTHLTNGFAAHALASGIQPSQFVTFDVSKGDEAKTETDQWTRRFISEYDRLKREGGLLLISASVDPRSLTENPHVQSRLLAGAVLRLEYPRESELEPLIASLAERHNLRLSERNIGYLLNRLPLRPLSFDNIFAKISELSLSQGKPAKQGLVKDAISRLEIP